MALNHIGDIVVPRFLILSQRVLHNSTLYMLVYQLLVVAMLCKIDMDFAMEKPANIYT